jgi:hypothetical protein
MAGYLHASYARSLAEFGKPRFLPHSQGWLLERPIAGTSYVDVMGCYPLFSCPDWDRLGHDLDEAAGDMVSVSLVADPFGNYRFTDLKRLFGGRAFPFKEHFIADLRHSPNEFVSTHHRYYAKRVLQSVQVERVDQPAAFVAEWCELYSNVIKRYRLQGIKAFSPRAFAAQLNVPGIVMLRAHREGQTLGAHLWYLQGDVAYSHLAASNTHGHALSVAYALNWAAIETFAGGTRWLDFGGTAGFNAAASDGLTFFKRGWSTGTRTAYFCGRVFDERKYAEAAAIRGLGDNGYFPAYRKGELI